MSLSILLTASAYAADGYVTGNVYLRAGPDPGYPSVAILDAGTPVAIEGCVNGWSWCGVDAGGNGGWVAGTFLQDDYRGQHVLVPQYGVQIGIPIISFVFATYWQDHYRNRPWYAQRTHWSQVQPHYQTVAVRDDSHGNSRGRPNTSGAPHDTTPRTRGEPNRAAVAAAPAREAKPTRAATRQRSVAANVRPVSHPKTLPSHRSPCRCAQISSVGVARSDAASGQRSPKRWSHDIKQHAPRHSRKRSPQSRNRTRTNIRTAAVSTDI